MAPRKKKIPTVKRGAGGRIESLRTPIAPLADTPVVAKPDLKYAVPPRPKSTRKKTRTGKKLDKVTGKVLQPSVKRDESGKIVALSPEERRAAVTTVLPTFQQKPERQPSGLIGMGARPDLKGAKGGSYPKIKAAVQIATALLGHMRDTYGTPEFHSHHELFNQVHAEIGRMSPELHQSLGQAKHFVSNPGPNLDSDLALVHKAINARLGIIAQAHDENLRRAEAGRTKKAGQ